MGYHILFLLVLCCEPAWTLHISGKPDEHLNEPTTTTKLSTVAVGTNIVNTPVTTAHLLNDAQNVAGQYAENRFAIPEKPSLLDQAAAALAHWSALEKSGLVRYQGFPRGYEFSPEMETLWSNRQQLLRAKDPAALARSVLDTFGSAVNQLPFNNQLRLRGGSISDDMLLQHTDSQSRSLPLEQNHSRKLWLVILLTIIAIFGVVVALALVMRVSRGIPLWTSECDGRTESSAFRSLDLSALQDVLYSVFDFSVLIPDFIFRDSNPNRSTDCVDGDREECLLSVSQESGSSIPVAARWVYRSSNRQQCAGVVAAVEAEMDNKAEVVVPSCSRRRSNAMSVCSSSKSSTDDRNSVVRDHEMDLLEAVWLAEEDINGVQAGEPGVVGGAVGWVGRQLSVAASVGSSSSVEGSGSSSHGADHDEDGGGVN